MTRYVIKTLYSKRFTLYVLPANGGHYTTLGRHDRQIRAALSSTLRYANQFSHINKTALTCSYAS